MNMDLTPNTIWQMVDRFARRIGVKDPVLDLHFSLWAKYERERGPMSSCWPETTFYWDEPTTTVAPPEAAMFGTVLSMEEYAELAEMARECDFEIKNVKPHEPDKHYGVGMLYGVRAWWEDNM